jgi:hypothetical protein
MSAVKKPQKTLKIELFAQNKPGDAKSIRPAHPGTGIGRVIAAMTGRRKRRPYQKMPPDRALFLAHRMGAGTGEG